jgi:hypothetical protein
MADWTVVGKVLALAAADARAFSGDGLVSHTNHQEPGSPPVLMLPTRFTLVAVRPVTPTATTIGTGGGA